MNTRHETRTGATSAEVGEMSREADKAREEVSRMTRDQKSELESAARAKIRGAKSARATCGTRL